jgi:hypothetical protein
MVDGLTARGEARARARVAIFVARAVSAQVARNWLMLHAIGVAASVFDATAVLIAVSALGVLPVGPGVGAGAMVLILGSNGVACVSAAGVLLTATGTDSALGYGGWALTDHFWTKRRTSAKATVVVARCHDGTELAVIHGPPAEQRALELTGAADCLTFRSGS